MAYPARKPPSAHRTGQHGRNLVAQPVKQGAHVGVEYARICCVVLFGQGRALFLEARVVEHGIEPPEAMHRRRDQLRDVRLLCHVSSGEHALHTLRPHLRRHRLARACLAACDHDSTRAFQRHPQRGCPADSAAYSGDQAYLAC